MNEVNRTWNETQSESDRPDEGRADKSRTEIEGPLAKRMRDGHKALDGHERQQQKRNLCEPKLKIGGSKFDRLCEKETKKIASFLICRPRKWRRQGRG